MLKKVTPEQLNEFLNILIRSCATVVTAYVSLALFAHKKRPEAYEENKAAWYTGAAVYAVCGAVVTAAAVMAKLMMKKKIKHK